LLSMAHVLAPLANIVPIPPPDIGPLPNFGNLNDHVQGVAQEFALLQNLPLAAMQQQLHHLQNQSDVMIQHLQQLTDTMNGMTNAMNGMTAIMNGVRATYLPFSFASSVIYLAYLYHSVSIGNHSNSTTQLHLLTHLCCTHKE